MVEVIGFEPTQQANVMGLQPIVTLQLHSTSIYGGVFGIRTQLLSSLQVKWPPPAVPYPIFNKIIFWYQVRDLNSAIYPYEGQLFANDPWYKLDALTGLEPVFSGPKPDVLPLDDNAIYKQ